MSDEQGWLKNFVENFGKVPEGEPREFIPPRLRIPVFLGMVVVSLVLLALLLWLVVIPAIRAQSPAPHSEIPALHAAARA
ncbi:MAG: hypothetical protein P4L93_07355 [Coriobacteriia bacterium]|nr:hypothetical protein [Coriobacteriia bacterium]